MNEEPAVEPLWSRAEKHAIDRAGPAQNFFEGALLGNGGLGAVVTTRPDAVVVHFGHNAVWDIRLHELTLEEIGTFEDVLRNLDDGRNSAWYEDYKERMERPYRQPYPHPFPCGSLVLGFDRQIYEVLGHRLSIVDGTCTVELRSTEGAVFVQIFVDQLEDRLWVSASDDRGNLLPSPFNRARLLPDPDGLRVADGAAVAELAVSLTKAGEPSIDDSIEVLPLGMNEGIAFRQRLPASAEPSVTPADQDQGFILVAFSTSLTEPEERRDWYGKLVSVPALERSLLPQDEFVLCVQLAHGLYSDLSRPTIARVDPHVLAAARAQSVASWAKYWEKSAVSLADEMLEQVWYRNTYFLNCAVREGKVCPGLFGNWSYRQIGTAWHGDYHLNYNTQQVFWGAFSSNRADLHGPYVDLVNMLLPVSKGWAKNYFGMRGAYFPHTAYPVEMTTMSTPNPPWGWEVCETPWAVQSLWWHFTYTQDLEFLRREAFEPVRQATLFLVDYISRPDARGDRWSDDRWHIFPTVAPEMYDITPGLYLNADCLADLTLTRFVLNAYLEACDLLGVVSDELDLMSSARAVLDRLPDYATAETPHGSVYVSVPGAHPRDVYNVPIPAMTVFPGEEHGIHSDPARRELAERSYRHQNLEGGNELVFANLQGARLGILDLEKFKRQISYCLLPNGTCTDMVLQSHGRYNDTTPYDFMAGMGVFVENFALTGVINECLMQGYDGTISLFPNWPPQLDARFESLRAKGAFLVSATLAGGVVRSFSIRCEAGGKLRIDLPWPEGGVCLRGDKTEEVAGTIEFTTGPDEHLEFTRLVR